MHQNEKRLARTLAALFTAVFCLLAGGIALAALFATVRRPEEYEFAIRPSRMLACLGCWAVLWGAAHGVLTRLWKRLCRYETVLGCMLLAGIALLSAVLGFVLETTPMNDQYAVVSGARQLLQTGTLGDQQGYFTIFPNNLGGVALLALWLRFFDLFGAAGQSWPCLLLNVLLITGSAALLWRLMRRLCGARQGLLALFGLACCVPLYCYAAVYYTDTMAMPCTVGGVLLYVCAVQAQTPAVRAKYLAGCGVVLALGFFIKATVLVVLAAVLIHALLQGAKAFGQALACAALCLALCLGLGGPLKEALLPAQPQNDGYALPYTHWVMMGLNGDGRWNNADEVFSARFDSAEQARAANLQQIKLRVQEYGVGGILQLFGRKTMYTFADGTYNVASMLDDGPVRPGILHGVVTYPSPHFMLLFYLCTSLHSLALLTAALRAGKDLVIGGAVPNGVFVLRLAFFGLWLFLMLWESNARYLVHFLPVLYGCAFGSTVQKPLAAQEQEK